MRRQLAKTPVEVVEIFPPALDTGLAPDLVIPGIGQNGPDVIDEVAKRSVEGILAGERHGRHGWQENFGRDRRLPYLCL